MRPVLKVHPIYTVLYVYASSLYQGQEIIVFLGEAFFTKKNMFNMPIHCFLQSLTSNIKRNTPEKSKVINEILLFRITEKVGILILHELFF
jgi:hypothetical protein